MRLQARASVKEGAIPSAKSPGDALDCTIFFQVFITVCFPIRLFLCIFVSVPVSRKGKIMVFDLRNTIFEQRTQKSSVHKKFSIYLKITDYDVQNRKRHDG
ncbi:MAG TPA: hypothetical protein DEF88_05205 [Porphyromonadaceae bacterium]|nr:hypothetical protein [Porphyromonadaceae bacterium]HCM21713.1 hypothetical protein [Porphyromonadaceae bacterium]